MDNMQPFNNDYLPEEISVIDKLEDKLIRLGVKALTARLRGRHDLADVYTESAEQVRSGLQKLGWPSLTT